MEPLYLPNLEERTLARFDELAEKEKIFYEEAISELITVNGFHVSTFLFFSSIAPKQILSQLTHPSSDFPSPYAQRKK
jgi:ATP adenylyltransferase